MGSLLRDLVALSWRALTLPVFVVLAALEPIVRAVLMIICILGLISTMVVGWSGAAPRFPFVGALLFFGACGAVAWLYRALVQRLDV